MAEFVEYYNNYQYHESLNNLTPLDVFFGRVEEKLKQKAGQEKNDAAQESLFFPNKTNGKEPQIIDLTLIRAHFDIYT